MIAALALGLRETGLVLLGFAAGAVAMVVSPPRREPGATALRRAEGSRSGVDTSARPSGRSPATHVRPRRRPYDWAREAA